MILDFDQVPQWYISTSLTDNQKDTIAVKWFVYNTIDPKNNILEQCRKIAEDLLDHDILISAEGIRRYYYKDNS